MKLRDQILSHNIFIFKLNTGETILAELLSISDTMVTIDSPIELSKIPGENGLLAMHWTPWFPFSEDSSYTLSRPSIVLMCKPLFDARVLFIKQSLSKKLKNVYPEGEVEKRIDALLSSEDKPGDNPKSEGPMVHHKTSTKPLPSLDKFESHEAGVNLIDEIKKKLKL